MIIQYHSKVKFHNPQAPVCPKSVKQTHVDQRVETEFQSTNPNGKRNRTGDSGATFSFTEGDTLK
jgi:hypothetical protein